ncbi:ABC transporter ATP-binding protein [Pseudoalteromonas sp. GCY]|uniref:ABC transporter ATP-binding protein n=1 Tax=Pseudoalteromonas sp. GCY TaxID=2003316 RepID=UPI000BFF0970|nr:ABC transporter ATP-binding protein [Pseudoalteromonas sp. GCY]PHI36188.1 ABC transporter ATP-binding protein [Pseudoalteromonas sp. GCY]QQQ65455.1 ABC transporter ATP-binding protein [Pseudoalteromonas sp. GCY]
MEKSPILTLQKVSKVYRTKDVETHALSDINLTIREGDYLSISGPSGSGKSTLLSILGLLDNITSGSYKVHDTDTHTLDADTQAELRNRHIGFVFQSFNLLDSLNVFDNVALPLEYREPALSSGDIKQRVERALAQVEMTHRANHKPNQLSGGQQQRVAIARALAGSPSILLVDEPTGNLDSANGDAVMALLSELNENGTTICMVTHDIRYAGYAKQQIQLLDGKLVSQSSSAKEVSLSEAT